MKDRLIKVVSQAFYGNRTGTEILPEEIDQIVLGWLDKKWFLRMHKKIDRPVIKVPGTEQLVLIYNKYAEERERQWKEELFKDRGRVLKPLAAVPELGIVLYSRCIACRMDQDGNLKSLEGEDYGILWKYLAE